MNGASKILTVSYGTFSCTLEGFDDPFNTMKAIAEYFRDLAADDRYFGAEPPTPDAAMLHKIAEREIQRRVEAKIGDNGVVLRAEEAPMPRITMPAVQPAPAYAPPPAAPSVATMAEAGPVAESAAARLSRLRAAQSQLMGPQFLGPQTLTVQPAPAPVLADISSRFADVEADAEDQDAETAFTPAPIVPAPVAVAPVAVAPVAVAPVAVAPVAVAPVAVAPVAVTPSPEMQADLTEKTVQPAAVVADAEPAPEAETSDDAVMAALHQSINAPEPQEAPAQPETEVQADTEAQPKTEAQSEAPSPEPGLDALRETLAGLLVQDEQLAEDMARAADGAPGFNPQAYEAQAFEAPAFEAPAFEADDEYPAESTFPEGDAEIAELPDMEQFDAPAEVVDQAEMDDLAALDGTAPIIDDAAYVEDAPAAIETEAAEPHPATTGDESDVADVAASPEAPVVAEKIQRARARVIKIRRLDKKSEADAPAPATLTPEDEADLQSTLAALTAEIAPVADLSPAADQAPLAAIPEAPAPEKASESKLVAADDAAVDRLLAHANSELEVPETKRRRSAIAHLKAAVLATVADRRINPKAGADVAEVKMDPYRKDLDKAVRPVTTPVPTERPAPLVLVSAQRIDRKRDAVADGNRPVPQIVASTAAPQPAATNLPVRPRRVTSGGLAQVMPAEISDEDSDQTPDDMGNIFADDSRQSFAEFAENLGATSIAELIEAAGAYCTLVLDRPSFTRPQLFQHISTMPHMADANREDGLRGFGKLLRDGRIQKTVRGQYALSATSPVLTEAKRIAG